MYFILWIAVLGAALMAPGCTSSPEQSSGLGPEPIVEWRQQPFAEGVWLREGRAPATDGKCVYLVGYREANGGTVYSVHSVRLNDGMVLWHRDVEGNGAGGGPVLCPVGESLVMATAKGLLWLDAQTGAERSSMAFDPPRQPTNIAAVGAGLCISFGNGQIEMIEGQRVVWTNRNDVDGGGGLLLFHAGILVCCSGRDRTKMVGLRATDGVLAWERHLPSIGFGIVRRSVFETGDTVASGNTLCVNALAGGPALDPRGYSGYVAGLDCATGVVRWQSSLPSPGYAYLAVDDGQVYASVHRDVDATGAGGRWDVFCLDLSTGDRKWQCPLPRGPSGQWLYDLPPIVWGKVVVVARRGGGIVGISTVSGKILWSPSFPELSKSPELQAVVSGESIVLASSSGVVSLLGSSSSTR